MLSSHEHPRTEMRGLRIKIQVPFMYHINFLKLTSFALFCFEGGIVVLGQEMNLFLFFFF